MLVKLTTCSFEDIFSSKYFLFCLHKRYRLIYDLFPTAYKMRACISTGSHGANPIETKKDKISPNFPDDLLF